MQHNRPGDTFRGWLRTITKNKVVDLIRIRGKTPLVDGGTEANDRIQQVADLKWEEDDDSRTVEKAELLERALTLVQGDFEHKTWQAFWLTTVEGIPTSEVAEKLAMQTGAIRQAKFRVLQRIREEFGDLIQ